MSKYVSKVDLVYDGLINSIRQGEYRNGDRLVISRIAREYNVSEIPVREAIRRLQSAGYAKLKANQGAEVSNLDEKSLVDLFHVKSVLESYAARLAVGKISSSRMTWLRQKNREQREAFEERNIRRYSELNKKFHLAIYKCADNDLLLSLIEDLWDKWAVGQMTRYVSEKRYYETMDEHDRLLDLMEEGKADEVEELMRQHKLRAAQEVNANSRKEKDTILYKSIIT